MQRETFLLINFFVKYFRFYIDVKTATPPPNSHPLFPGKHPLKIEIMSSIPTFGIGFIF